MPMAAGAQAMPPAEAPAQGAPDQQEADDSAIVDQIGELLQKLEPAKQKMVLMALTQLIGGPTQDAGGSPEQGGNPNAVPAQGV